MAFRLGHVFRPMDKYDRSGHPEATAGTLICYPYPNDGSIVLLLTPEGEVIVSDYNEDTGTVIQRWKRVY